MPDTIPADTTTTATLAVGGSVQSAIDVTGDRDWYRIVLTPGSYQFDLRGQDSGGGSLEDPRLFLRDATGSSITFSDDRSEIGSYDSRIAFTTAAAGTFYLDAEAVGNTANGSTGTYTLSAARLNAFPTARGEVLQKTPEDTPLTVDSGVLLRNDTDLDREALTVSAVGNAQNGTVGLANGRITFTPSANYSGPASFDYTVSDGRGGTATATATLDVTPVNDPIVARDDVFTTLEDTVLRIPVTTVLANDSDADDDTVFLSSWSFPLGNDVFRYDNNGTGTTEDDAFVFTPRTNVSGVYEFAYGAASLSGGTGGRAVVRVTVEAVNDAPVPVPLADQSGTEDQPLQPFTVPPFLDLDGDALTYAATLADGTALPDWLRFDAATRTFSGTPPANLNGALDVTVTGSDGQAAASDAFTLAIAAVNDAPVVSGPISFTVTEDDPALVLDLLANASDADAGAVLDALGTDLASDPDAGLVFDDAANTLAVDPSAPRLQGLAAGEVLTVNYSYLVTDGQASTSTVVAIAFVGANDAPVAPDLADQSSPEDRALSFQVPAFADVDAGTPLAYGATLANGDPLPAWLAFDPGSRTFSGTPPADFAGALDLTVTGSDGRASASDTFRLTIDPVNDAPTALALSGGTVAENAAVGTVAGTLAATDPDAGDAATFSLVAGEGGAGNAAFVVVGNELRLAASPDYEAQASYSVRVRATDAAGASVERVLAVAVTDVAETRTITGTSRADTLRGDGRDDVILGLTGNDKLYGEGGADALKGGAGLDALWGGTGDDTLNGEAGVDALWGGAGADTFVIARQGDLGVDAIGDFRAEDVVRIQGFAGVDGFEDLRVAQKGAVALVSWAGGAVAFTDLQGPLVADDFIFG